MIQTNSIGDRGGVGNVGGGMVGATWEMSFLHINY